jgi:hypothetical protein
MAFDRVTGVESKRHARIGRAGRGGLLRHLSILVLLGLLGALYPAATGHLRVQAQVSEGDIEVLQQTAESRVPEGIRFTVTARSSSEIDDIRVFFRILGSVRRSGYSTLEFEPGTEVTATAFVQSGSTGNYFPPGTELQYSFEIRDKSGAEVRTQRQGFVYLDDRFEWLTVNSGLITVYYYNQGLRGRAEGMLAAAEQTLTLMKPVLGIEPTDPLRIVTYDDYRDMATVLPFRSQATADQLRTQGTFFSNQRVLLVHGADRAVYGVTSHEFVHLLVSEAAGKADSDVPSWLNEGLAEYGNIEPTGTYDNALRYGIEEQRIRPLWLQGSFGGTPQDIIIAYGQAKSVVRHLVDSYGPDKMAETMRVLRKTRDIDLALTQVYGFGQYGLDSEWRRTQGMEPLSPPAQSEPEIIEAPAIQALPTLAPELPTATPKPPPEPTAEAPPAPSLEPTAPPFNGREPDIALGCYAPIGLASSVFGGDLAMLLLLLAPLGLVGARFVRAGPRD